MLLTAMPLSLLLAKLVPPTPDSHLVSRPRLLKCLGEGLAGPLTVVTAPAGFGKTTLLAEWVVS
jgi:LuxR family maltose regulon positive regulatory protein